MAYYDWLKTVARERALSFDPTLIEDRIETALGDREHAYNPDEPTSYRGNDFLWAVGYEA